jgi:hypothetical protein
VRTGLCALAWMLLSIDAAWAERLPVLPVPTVNFLLETRSGTYWVATNGAASAAWMQPEPPPHRRNHCFIASLSQAAQQIS